MKEMKRNNNKRKKYAINTKLCLRFGYNLYHTPQMVTKIDGKHSGFDVILCVVVVCLFLIHVVFHFSPMLLFISFFVFSFNYPENAAWYRCACAHLCSVIWSNVNFFCKFEFQCVSLNICFFGS